MRARPLQCVLVLVHAYLLSTISKKKKISLFLPFDPADDILYIHTYMHHTLGFLITLCMSILFFYSLSLFFSYKERRKNHVSKRKIWKDVLRQRDGKRAEKIYVYLQPLTHPIIFDVYLDMRC